MDDDKDKLADDHDANRDFDVFYDPERNIDNHSYNNTGEFYVFRGYINEISNGRDDDGDGYIDEDLALGNGKDDDK